MGKRGPKKTPTATLKIRGSWRAGQRGGEPQPEGAIGPCPDWLKEFGREKWEEVVAILQPLGLATPADRDALTRYCHAWQDFREAIDFIEKHGPEIVTDKGNLIPNPAVHRMQAAQNRLDRIGGKFGMTPSERADLHAAPQKTADKSKFFKKNA